MLLCNIYWEARVAGRAGGLKARLVAKDFKHGLKFYLWVLFFSLLAVARDEEPGGGWRGG